MRGLVVFLALASCGCAEMHERALGTRVHQFTIKDRQYVHCSILVDKAQPQMTHEALELCRVGIEAAAAQPPQR